MHCVQNLAAHPTNYSLENSLKFRMHYPHNFVLNHRPNVLYSVSCIKSCHIKFMTVYRDDDRQYYILSDDRRIRKWRFL